MPVSMASHKHHVFVNTLLMQLLTTSLLHVCLNILLPAYLSATCLPEHPAACLPLGYMSA
jgi:hypothetical protein